MRVAVAIGGEVGGAGPLGAAAGKAERAEAGGQRLVGEASGGLPQFGLAMAASPLKVCIVGSGNW